VRSYSIAGTKVKDFLICAKYFPEKGKIIFKCEEKEGCFKRENPIKI